VVQDAKIPESPGQRNSRNMSQQPSIDVKPLPKMRQAQFIQMWKSLYDLFSGKENEQQVYHSIASVGTVLLKLGEIAIDYEKQSNKSKPTSETESIASDSFEVVAKPDFPRELLWNITFEQFFSALYTETPLVEFFEMKYEISQFIDKLRNRKVIERSSSVLTTGSNNWNVPNPLTNMFYKKESITFYQNESCIND